MIWFGCCSGDAHFFLYPVCISWFLFYLPVPLKLTIKLAHMKKNFLHLCYLFLLLLATRTFAQDPPQYGTPFAAVPDVRDVTMYQVNIRPFSSTHNLPGVTARLDQIKALGTNVIYLMPVYPVGTLRSLNSPYCIKDFQSVGAEYGSLTDL